ncbi:hypothetical protein GQX73_g5134 [Xylaria multiplex]|uniref:DNA-directed RNA polymerase n=1 Tax=Xylaria multiplex TaxID=323545 RepID=A0A7C8IRG9_9PEZI|nr:hypothetical protein GQX73_g5134 [Xylaria multiplex]
MLLRYRPAPGSLSLPHIHTLRRPQLPSRYTSLYSTDVDTSISHRRLLVTRPKLASWRRKTTPTPLSSAVAYRSLATAVDDPIRQTDLRSHHIPNHYVQPPPSSLPLYHLRPFDPTTTLHARVQDDVLTRSRTTQSGIPGGIDEMISVFDACLDVDKLERAALVLERFEDREGFSYRDLIALHNQYLRAGIERALEHPESQWAQSLHQWFEVQIRGKGIPYTPETIACMLKISLLSTQGQRLNRLVTRYLEMLPEKDAIWPVLETEVLNQQDIGIITRIYNPASDLLTEESESTVVENEAEETPSIEVSPSENVESKNIPVPGVLPVSQKGLGLKTLRGVLSFFDQIEGQDLTKLSIEERREIQARLEKDCVEAAIRRWRDENQTLAKMGRNSTLAKPALNSQLYQWQTALEGKLKKDFALFDKSETSVKKTAEDIERCLYAPFMRQSTPARLAAVTIMTILNLITYHGADKGVPLSSLLTSLAKTIEEDVRFQMQQRAAAARKANFRREHKLRTAGISASQPGKESTATQNSNIIEVPTYDSTTWPALIKAKVGAQLLSGLLESAKIKVVREHPETKALVSQMQPAMARTTLYRKGKKIGVIMPNKVLVALMKQEPRGDFLARHLPMLVEPRPWTKFEHGGFIEYPSQLVRIKNGERDQRIYTEAAIARGDLEQVSKGLDVLGRTAWKINRPVFDVLLEAWNTGEEIANIPPLDPNIPIPEEPHSSEDPMTRRDWLKRVKMAENEKSGLHSERCFMNFQLDIARAFRDQTFYFPHNLDFRGRAYPIPAYLNHMGADHVRGILRFANGKELGETGLRWLKVQLANVFGFDKASLDEREAFAMDHIKDIYDSATNPLAGGRWWLKAEDPWQCLAACFELKAALESPEPARYVSHLPVHQDGTCNGLQHYAALGGDRWGAQQVNLLPGDRPADVYSAVADLVKEGIKEDLAAGIFLAQAVDGKITRKVVKQTVMTNVYGVTFVGAKAQVLKQIDAAYPNIESEHGIPSIVLAAYITTKIFKALSTMFRGAHDIQYWLGECAGRVCRALTPEQLDRIASDTANDQKTKKSRSKRGRSTAAMEEILNQFRSTIVWTTPLRMPIVQPYQCDELGLSFAAVHDSFWTHAADVDVMNRVLRDAFIRIHSEDVIGRLSSEFQARYKGSLYLAKVARGTDAERKITALRNGNRQSLQEELLEERERQRLLASSDPGEVQMGMAMVTPASIHEKFSSEPLPSNDELDEVALGNISSSDAHAEDVGEDVGADVSTDISADESSIREEADQAERLLKVSHFEATLKKMTAATSPKATPNKPKTEHISIWLPLTFPAIPSKGDFDVAELKSSQYFFS